MDLLPWRLPDLPASPVVELNAEGALAWLSAHLDFRPTAIRMLSGGVSSNVFLAENGDRRVVVKQALPQLRVEAEWLCDRRRATTEALALDTLGELLGEGTVPLLLASDPEQYTFAMSAAPENAGSWKERLLAGNCEPAVARAAGQALALLIDRTAGRFQSEFGDMTIFDDLRLDAYYRYTGVRHPDLAGYFSSLIDDCYNRRFSLVHGDFSPKNMLTDGNSAMIIDWECVHYGNPAFDMAFLLNHLLLKSFVRPERMGELELLAQEFTDALSGAGPDWLAESAFRHWPGLLLARMDGKSPVEYIRDPSQRAGIRELARDLIANPAASAGEVFQRRRSGLLC